jgi:metallo-beta-lactamase family protein
MELQFLGAAGRVTGSCYLLRVNGRRVLLECGQIQGSRAEEALNRDPLPADIDAVVLSHAHIDHSGRLPLLMRQGFTGPIHTHHATRALCEIMLRDSGYLHEKDAEWENRKRQRKGLPRIEPLYTQADGEAVIRQFVGLDYGDRREIVPGVEIRFSDAGHILGAAIVELWLTENGRKKKVVFSGDLGFRDAPVMPDPARIAAADLVLLESTYGDRLHRSAEETLAELKAVFAAARDSGGNVIIPAFAVGRTQDLLFLLAEHFDAWGIGRWRVFLDSPMAIEATEAYSRYRHLYDAPLFAPGRSQPVLRNLVMSRSSEDSAAINQLQSGAIVIAGSGMCNGGRIVHHLKHNLGRDEAQVLITGYQARGSLGRRLVDGEESVRIHGQDVPVRATVHTLGGFSAHGDQDDLARWYECVQNRPPVYLVHGERESQEAFAEYLGRRAGAEVHRPRAGETLDLTGLAPAPIPARKADPDRVTG